MVSIDGNFLPRASVLTINYSLGQNFNTPVGYFDWLVSAQTKTKYYMTPFNGEGVNPTTGEVNPNLSDVVPAYTRLDASIGFTHPGGKLRFEVIGSNLTNIAYMTSIINTPSLNLRFFNPPRQLGVRLTGYL
jgi:iron complex outermembrane receptor protein